MRVQADSAVAEFVRHHGGRLFVWSDASRCCTGATTFLETSTIAPAGEHAFDAVGCDAFSAVPAPDEPFQLLVDFRGRTPPEVLELELRGRRRKRVRAYWNGCAYVLR